MRKGGMKKSVGKYIPKIHLGMIKMVLEKGLPYSVKTIDRNFVGYFQHETDNTTLFRIGLNENLLMHKKEIKTVKRLSPRDIETRKSTGRFFIF